MTLTFKIFLILIAIPPILFVGFLCYKIIRNSKSIARPLFNGYRTIPMGMRSILFLLLLATGLKMPWYYFEDNLQTEKTEYYNLRHSVYLNEGYKRMHMLVESDIIRVDKRVNYKNLRPEISYSLPILISCFRDVMGDDFVFRISSANDRVHSMRSNHYKNLAIDIATTNDGVNYQQALRIKNLILQKLETGFRVIYGTDRDHMNHMHFDYIGKPWDEEKILSLMVVEASKKYNVDPAVVMAMIKVVSGFDHNHESEGQMGLMGLKKPVCLKLKIDNPYDPFANIVGGIQHLQDMLNLYNNDLEIALAAYISDTETIEAHKREYWKIPEVRFFVDNVIIFYSDYQKQGYRPI